MWGVGGGGDVGSREMGHVDATFPAKITNVQNDVTIC